MRGRQSSGLQEAGARSQVGGRVGSRSSSGLDWRRARDRSRLLSCRSGSGCSLSARKWWLGLHWRARGPFNGRPTVCIGRRLSTNRDRIGIDSGWLSLEFAPDLGCVVETRKVARIWVTAAQLRTLPGLFGALRAASSSASQGRAPISARRLENPTPHELKGSPSADTRADCFASARLSECARRSPRPRLVFARRRR